MSFKNRKVIIATMSLLFILIGCTNKESVGIKSNQSSSSSIDYQSIVKEYDKKNGVSQSSEIEKGTKESEVVEKYNGYDLGGYTFHIMNRQKESGEFINLLSSDFDLSIKENFETYKYKINNKQKVNLIPYLYQINSNDESISTNYFLVNNSDIVVKELSISGYPKIEKLNIENITTIAFDKKTFTNLPSKGVVTFTITMNMTKEDALKIRNNKVANSSFDITELEINGEKVSNVNEN